MCPSRWRARSGSATVLTTASSEPRPWGTSKACVQAGNGWELKSSGRIGHCDVGPEVGVINPHPMKDHTDASCQSEHGALCATAAGNLCGSCSQPCRTPTVHHDSRTLTQRAAQSEDSPTVVMIEFRIGPADKAAFVEAAYKVSAERYRNGATRGALIHDVTDPAIWIEVFHLPSCVSACNFDPLRRGIGVQF